MPRPVPRYFSSSRLWGCNWRWDDFGTGYSSLRNPHRFPIDVLKIDRSLVHDIDSINGHGIIVSGVIAMRSCLKQGVIAEGVEKRGQLGFLKAHYRGICRAAGNRNTRGGP